jgi:hypothetical protein
MMMEKPTRPLRAKAAWRFASRRSPNFPILVMLFGGSRAVLHQPVA